jgi:tetratricopeptide (TPR) repeat protein
MTSDSRYPRTIERRAERDVKDVLDRVCHDGHSRVLLLYGTGGMGKTSLVRRMAKGADDSAIRWLDPIDVDDSHYWLLSNLETRVVESLEPVGDHFDDYRKQLSQLPSYARENISLESVVSYLGRVKDSFARCYSDYVKMENKTVVVIFDTVETIRDTILLSTLAQWMKVLPRSTLFILSGRPVTDGGVSEVGWDPIESELKNPHYGMPVEKVELGRFGQSASIEYLDASGVSDDLADQEKEKLAVLTRGQPLWLAFAIDYLMGIGVPAEADRHSLEYMAEHIPYNGEMTPEGERLHESFLRSMIAPYRKSDFWHEATKRLAVVRQPIEQVVWERLMADLGLPDGASSWAETWGQLLEIPWMRQRGNGRYVTLHDAVAEAFAQRLFPLHDPDQEWRKGIWERARDIYTALAKEREEELLPRLAALDEELRSKSTGQDSEIIDLAMELDADERELDQLKAARLYYLFLTDFKKGCQALLGYFEQADKERDTFIKDLLVLHLQRFLPGGAAPGAFEDVIRPKVEEFRRWLAGVRPDLYVAIGIMVAAHLIEASQPEAALRLIEELPENQATSHGQYRMHILRGNAWMRIPGGSRMALRYFERTLDIAMSLKSPDRLKLIAKAHKERGYYRRNIGDWKGADVAYEKARDAIVAAIPADSPGVEFDEVASIQANWAYVKALGGNYSEATHLAESAVTMRRQFGSAAAEGISWSVVGEVYRYARRFEKAWAAYAEAERLLQGRPSWNWLGIIYQQQAICLHQALQDGINLTDAPGADAKRLITSALDICLSRSIRAYPSALNRAGRIFGQDDPDTGLDYLDKGIAEARRLSDNWFLLANLVEYATLSYQTWMHTRNAQYITNITVRADEISAVAQEYGFPDLVGRWTLLQGHLYLESYLVSHSESDLRDALDSYQTGFGFIAQQPSASSGTAALAGEFENFEQLFRRLPPRIQSDWHTRLRAAWRGSIEGSTLLLARLQEVLARLQEAS